MGGDLTQVQSIVALAQGLQTGQSMNQLMGTVTKGMEASQARQALRDNMALAKEAGVPFTPSAAQKKVVHDSIAKAFSDLF